MEATDLAERIAKLERMITHESSPNNLKGRVVELERLRRPKGARFFMIWGRDEADLATKLTKAKADRDLLPGDRFDTKIWTCSSAPSPPRWTRLDEMSREELVILADGKDDHLHPSIACQWSDAELSDLYADSLRCLI
jgi:hypothetical protein